MNVRRQEGTSMFMRRYEEFRDDSGGWTFEIANCLDDINLIAPVDLPLNPSPQEAYRAVVFLEGFMQERKTESSRNNEALDRISSFESTAEVEAVAVALREIANRRDK